MFCCSRSSNALITRVPNVAMINVLVIEDDAEAGHYLNDQLNRMGYSVDVAGNLTAARELLAVADYDVIVLDRMLPDGDGLSFIDEIRRGGNAVPILVLSALGEVNHRVEGLHAGGDDYLVKPFDIAELAARIAVLSRRAQTSVPATEIHVGGLSIDLITHRVSREERDIRLQPREFKLLEYLARHAGQVVTRAMLLEAVWGLKFDPQTNVVDVHISRLRNKLDAGFPRPLLHTVRGEGYRLAEAP
jgi:two-component system OmpR family response regulator